MLNFLAAIPKIATVANVVGNIGSAVSKGGQRSSFAKLANVGAALGGGVPVATNGATERGQSVAIDIANTPPAESARSGEAGGGVTYNNPNIVPASYGMNVPTMSSEGMMQPAGLPAIITGSTALGTSAARMLGLGATVGMAAPMIVDAVTGQEKKLRVTRRLRSQVKQAVMMFGVEAVAEQMGTSVEVIFYILTKKMRNDGAYVTKAAVRKTRQTVRKMKHLCDMYDDLRPPARRSPARRTSSKTTLIKN